MKPGESRGPSQSVHGAYTLSMIDGTSYPATISTGVSSGWHRPPQQDIIHLYARTPVETKVVVLPA